MAVYFPSTIKRQIDLMLNSVRMTADLTTVFAFAAVLLGAIGVYSLTVTQVLQSAREFGIRMALGAEPQRLWRDFTRGHLLTVLIGVILGLVGASQAVLNEIRLIGCTRLGEEILRRNSVAGEQPGRSNKVKGLAPAPAYSLGVA